MGGSLPNQNATRWWIAEPSRGQSGPSGPAPRAADASTRWPHRVAIAVPKPGHVQAPDGTSAPPSPVGVPKSDSRPPLPGALQCMIIMPGGCVRQDHVATSTGRTDRRQEDPGRADSKTAHDCPSSTVVPDDITRADRSSAHQASRHQARTKTESRTSPHQQRQVGRSRRAVPGRRPLAVIAAWTCQFSAVGGFCCMIRLSTWTVIPKCVATATLVEPAATISWASDVIAASRAGLGR